MMYCEFIEISEYGENYITFTEYHDYIEPIYMDADLSKQDFVRSFQRGCAYSLELATPITSRTGGQ